MAWVHRARNPTLWGPGRQPVRPALVDWTHPLADGLIALYVPSLGLNNLAGLGANLTPASATAYTAASGGVALASTVANQAPTALVPSAMQPTQRASAFWLGSTTAVPSGNVDLISITHNNADASPYISFGLGTVASTGNLALAWNTAGTTGASLATGALNDTTGAINSYAATLDLAAGAAIIYKNGGQAASSAPTAGTSMGYGATASVNFCGYAAVPARFLNGAGLMGALWNRALSAQEMALLHADPYAMLIPEG